MAKDYDLVSGDSRISEIDAQLKTIEKTLTGNSYTPLPDDPNYKLRNKSTGLVGVPMFSEARDNLINLQRTLSAEKQTITTQLAEKAKTYTAPVGPQTRIIKKELELQKKYGATVVSPATAAVTPTTDAAQRIGFTPIKATEEPTPPPPPTGTSAGKPGKKITKSDVDAALVVANLTDTPENRKKVREQLKAGKSIKPSNWEALVAEQAGEYAYLLGPEFEGVPELLRKAVEQDWFSSEQGKAQFIQELKKTPYGLNTSTKQQQFDLKTAGNKKVDIQTNIDRIRTQYGEIQFDQATLEEIAGTAARNGASDIELGRLVYRAAFKRGAVSPDLTSPIAAKTALGGDDAARIKAIYRSYGVRADDEQVARILAGQPEPTTGTVMTEDMLRTNLRDLAKVSYQPFADLLDRGLSVQTIFSPYQQIAASTLEKSANDVALTDANGTPTQFASALMGEKPMSLTDWITKLKSDDKYGWQFTSEAKQQASNLVMELEKAFGYRK